MKDTRREEGVRQTGETGRANAITEGVIWKQLLLFFFPILFGTFFQQLYNTADAVVVGRFVGKEALAAVGGSTSMLTNLLVGFLWDFLRVRQLSSPSFTGRDAVSGSARQSTRRLPFRCCAVSS